jgi:hypothetical protein
MPDPYEQIQGTMTNGGVVELAEGGGLENVSEEIGLNVFNRLGRYWLGQFGMIRAGSVRNWATIRATNYRLATLLLSEANDAPSFCGQILFDDQDLFLAQKIEVRVTAGAGVDDGG